MIPPRRVNAFKSAKKEVKMSCTMCKYYYECPLRVRFKNDTDGTKCNWLEIFEQNELTK